MSFLSNPKFITSTGFFVGAINTVNPKHDTILRNPLYSLFNGFLIGSLYAFGTEVVQGFTSEHKYARMSIPVLLGAGCIYWKYLQITSKDDSKLERPIINIEISN